MATTQAIITISAEAGTAVLKHRFVTLAADGQYDHTADDGIPSGVSCDAQATVGRVFPMALQNGAIVKVEASGVIARGAYVSADAAGKAKALGSSDGDQRHGQALDAAAADGDIIRIRFAFSGQVNA